MKKTDLLFVAMLFPLLLSCFGGESATTAAGETAADTADEIAYPVVTQAAAVEPFFEYLRLNGEVSAADSVSLYPDIAGKIVSIQKPEGSSVRRGERVLTIDPSKPGADFTTYAVQATISGTVTGLPFAVGDTVSPQLAIAVISTLGRVEVTINVPERYSSLVSNGAAAELAFIAYPDESFAAKVVEISPVLNPLTRSVAVKLSPENPQGGIKVGMFAEVNLLLRQRQTLAIPSNAIIVRAGRALIFVVENDRAVERLVSTGVISQGQTEITAGLSSGEQVIISGQTLVADGVKTERVEP